MLTKEKKIQVIVDHINACRPCSMAHIISYAKGNGLGVGNVPQALQQAAVTYVTEDDGTTTVE